MKTRFIALLLSISSAFCAQNSIDANIPDKLTAYGTYTIEVVIKKGPISSFSKYQLDVPPNVIVKEGIGLDGYFSFENRRAKYVWVESPKTDEFKVTMILEIGNATGQASFEHRYYYIDGETKKEISDGPMFVDFLPGTPSAKPLVVETKTVTATPQTTVAAIKQEEPKKINITIPPSTPTTTTAPSNTLTSTSQPTTSSNTTPVSLPETKEYKVQIASMNTKPNMAKYSNIGKVTVIEENGLYKVVAGGFNTKEEAVKHMEVLKAKGFNGFVVLFVNGVKAK